jgi:hypothetical protein
MSLTRKVARATTAPVQGQDVAVQRLEVLLLVPLPHHGGRLDLSLS